MTLTLIIAFAIFVFLFALAIVFSGWPRWLKGMLTLGVVAFYFYGYQAVFSLLGNPSADPVPPRFLATVAHCASVSIQVGGAGAAPGRSRWIVR